MKRKQLAGCRVMVVEDEFLVSIMIETALTDAACIVVGPYANVADALAAAATADVDFAFLDVNVKGEKIYPVAQVLADRGVAFVLLSGYGQDAVPADRPDWRACSKPFTADQLTDILAGGLKSRPSGRPSAIR